MTNDALRHFIFACLSSAASLLPCHHPNMTSPKATKSKSLSSCCSLYILLIPSTPRKFPSAESPPTMNSLAAWDYALCSIYRARPFLFLIRLKHLRRYKKWYYFAFFLCSVSPYLRFSECWCLCVCSVNIHTLQMPRVFSLALSIFRRLVTSIQKSMKRERDCHQLSLIFALDWRQKVAAQVWADADCESEVSQKLSEINNWRFNYVRSGSFLSIPS